MLNPYKSIDEKKTSQNFDYHRVASFDELISTLGKYQRPSFCFRGQSDALWKIHSLAQRTWDKWECKSKCTKQSFDYSAWMRGVPTFVLQHPCVLPKCVREHVDNVGDHEVLGYLQHFGFPTTLVDFSFNVVIALYMAVRGICQPSCCTSKYFSIYGFDTQIALGKNEAFSLEEVVESYRLENGDNKRKIYNFNNWFKTHGLLLRKDSSSWCPAIFRGRIELQNGMFVHWPEEKLSLETLFSQFYKFNRNIPREKDAEENLDPLMRDFEAHVIHPENEIQRQLDRLLCIDVPYACAKKVQDYCSNCGVTEKSLGLDKKRIDKRLQKLLLDYKATYVPREKKGFIDKVLEFFMRAISGKMSSGMRASLTMGRMVTDSIRGGKPCKSKTRVCHLHDFGRRIGGEKMGGPAAARGVFTATPGSVSRDPPGCGMG